MLVKSLMETDVTTVGDSGLCTVDESGKNHGLVDTNLSLVLQVFLVPNVFVQSTKQTIPSESLLSTLPSDDMT